MSGSRVQTAIRQWATVLVPLQALACGSTVVVGARDCPTPPTDAGPDATLAGPLVLPWSTGFEDGFCEYAAPGGFCFGTGTQSYERVTSPVHSGRYAAAFSVDSRVDGGSQVRCVTQGNFPSAAYYGAWYFIPAAVDNTGLWNLFHFQGGDGGQTLHGLWDVSLATAADAGDLRAFIFDFLEGGASDTSAAPSVPIGQWFHLEVYFRRASDGTGELSLWQDDAIVARLVGVATDDTNWGQWYVGNLATALSPPSSVVYVDDVSIRATY